MSAKADSTLDFVALSIPAARETAAIVAGATRRSMAKSFPRRSPQVDLPVYFPRNQSQIIGGRQ
jgi:hypothetical protein